MRGWLCFCLALVACDGPDSAPKTFTVPSRETFTPVGEILHARCGSLDCHGQVGRSLRIYGTNGLRLAPEDRPGVDGGVTSEAEQDANYGAVVGLEPELLEQVTLEGGAHPERLTLIRKARGTEHHKGGTVIAEGGASDRCLTDWLKGIAGPTCADAAIVAQPPGF